MRRYLEDELKLSCQAILRHFGMPDEQAAVLTDNLIKADAYGVHSHGLTVLKAHVDRMRAKGYALTEEPAVVKQTAAFAVLDANNTVGAYSASVCMKLAMEKCRQSGIYTVFCRNCNTYGAAFYYTKMAADEKILGISFCNSPAAMPAWGGKEKLLGTNPFSVSVPGREKGPVIFDMATSIVAKSKINEARKRGEKIPEGWALDEHGISTTDPVEAIRGLVLPMAGAKGYGLSMTIDLIAGMLSGAACLDRVNRFYSEDGSAMNVGQVFIAIDPQIVMDDSFFDQVDAYIERIQNSASLTDQAVRFPGERKLQAYAESAAQGVEITDYALETLNALLRECGMEDQILL